MHTEMNIFDLFQQFVPEEYRTKSDRPKLTEAEFAQKQCDWYNESEGKLTGVDCQECKNRGNYQLLDSEGNRVMRECKCMAQRRYIQMMQDAGLGDLYERCTFDSYQVQTDYQKTSKALAWGYATSDGNGWLLFSGQSGVGKTHLCTAICGELAKRGMSIWYVQWKRLYSELVQTKYKQYEQQRIFADCLEADVLYIDDFLKMPSNAKPTDEMLSYALEIIDARYKADKKTIISTEFFSDDIIKFDEALGGRIKEKTAKNKIQILNQSGRNYRTKGE